MKIHTYYTHGYETFPPCFPTPQVRTLPALEPRSPSKKRPLPKNLETTAGFEPASTGERKDTPSPQPGKGLPSASPIKPSTAKALGPGASVNSIDPAAITAAPAAVVAAHYGNSDIGAVQQAAPCLPPLTKGSSRSVLTTSRSPSKGFAPSSGLGGELGSIERGNGGGKKWRDRQHAWVGGGGGKGGEEEEEEEFPFLVEDDVLLDDRFEVCAACGRPGTSWVRPRISYVGVDVAGEADTASERFAQQSISVCISQESLSAAQHGLLFNRWFMYPG